MLIDLIYFQPVLVIQVTVERKTQNRDLRFILNGLILQHGDDIFLDIIAPRGQTWPSSVRLAIFGESSRKGRRSVLDEVIGWPLIRISLLKRRLELFFV